MAGSQAEKKTVGTGRSAARRSPSGQRRRPGKPRWRRPSARQLEKIREDWAHCT